MYDHRPLQNTVTGQGEQGEEHAGWVAAGSANEVGCAQLFPVVLREPVDRLPQELRPGRRRSVSALEEPGVLVTKVRGEVDHHGVRQKGLTELRRSEMWQGGKDRLRPELASLPVAHIAPAGEGELLSRLPGEGPAADLLSRS